MKRLMVLAVASSWLVSWSPLFSDDDFVRGDCNNANGVDTTDAVLLLGYLANTGDALPWHFDSADVNDDGFLTMEDPLWITRFLFMIGPPPMPPYPDPGQDPTGDTIGQTSVTPPPEPAPNAHFTISLHEELVSPTQGIVYRVRIEYSDLAATRATIVYGAIRFDPSVLEFERIESLVGDATGCWAIDFGGGELGLMVNKGMQPANEIPEGDVARLIFTATTISPKPVIGLDYTVGRDNLHYYTGVGFYGPLEGGTVDPPPIVPKFAISVRKGERLFVRGDANGDRKPDVSDMAVLWSYFNGQDPGVYHHDALDVTDDGFLTFEDVIWLMRFLFQVGPPPPSPYPEPGFDPTNDTIAWNEVTPPPEPYPDTRYKVWLYWADSPEAPPGERVRMRLRILHGDDTANPPPNQAHAAIRYTPGILEVEEVRPLLGEGWEVPFVEFKDTSVDPPAPTGKLGLGLICKTCAQSPQPIPSNTDAVEVTFVVRPTMTPIVPTAELAYTVGLGNLHYYTGVGVLAPRPEGPGLVPVPKFIITLRETGSRFIRGDANGFNQDEINVDLSDAVYILSYLFTGTVDPPRCMDALDVNDVDSIEMADAIYLLWSLFIGGPPPPPPFGENPEDCGVDPTHDELDCKFYKPAYGV